VVVAVVVVATHKNSTTTAASHSKSTTTALGAKSPPLGGKTKATALTTPTTSAAGSKTTTTKTLGAKPAGKTAVPPTTVPGPQVLFDIQGTGDDTIGRFVIGTRATPWDVHWSYNCSKLRKRAHFNYTVVFINGARPDPNDLGPRQTGMSGSGLERYHNSGTFGMTVTTQCTWTVQISETNP
jgi:hypothetical protein